MEVLLVVVGSLLIISASRVVSPKVKLASPLILVLVGIVLSFLPMTPPIEIDPEWIIAGVLPPLLYASAVSVPTMEFRRDFTSITGLSVTLVLLSSVILGWVFTLLIPDLSIWWGIAMGAIVSPTDAVATSIVRKAGVRGRTVTMLEGESLLNDATALVLLRTAIAGAAASVGLWSAVGSFLFSIVVGLVLGVIVSWVTIRVRARIPDPTVNTIISLTAPFLASIPAELLGASGLFAAVVAGLLTGHSGPVQLSPQHRVADRQVWNSVELVLEGAIFLLMGLELAALIADVRAVHGSVGVGVEVALIILLGTLVVRALFTVVLLAGVRRRTQRSERFAQRYQQRQAAPTENPRLSGSARESLSRRILAHIEYQRNFRFSWPEGGVLIWAGMRGAITLAAAQTLPADAPHRSLLVLIAFLVAAFSLLIQGTTLSAVVRWLKPAGPSTALLRSEEEQLSSTLRQAAEAVKPQQGGASEVERSAVGPSLEARQLRAQRVALFRARSEGLYSSETLENALRELDARELMIQIKHPSAED